MTPASHNSMSYMKPQWWLRPFAFMAKCQSKDILKQYKAGARMFDLRIAFEKDGTPYFAHGLASYKGVNVYEVLDWLSLFSQAHEHKTGELIVVRVLNERNNHEAWFHDFCTEIDEKYPNLQFCGFRNKNGKGPFWNWSIRGGKGVGVGDTNDKFRIVFVNKYSSNNCQKHNNGHCTGWRGDDLCPWLYAWLYNKRNRRKFETADGFLMQDFIGVY